MAAVLRYVGGGAFFMHVPARDLTREDLERCPMSFDELAASGLYEVIGGVGPEEMPPARIIDEDAGSDCAACQEVSDGRG